MASHLTFEERDRIAQLRARGHGKGDIAQQLCRSASTIGREIARNSTGGEYLAATAHAKARRRRSERPLVRKTQRPAVDRTIRKLLASNLSPDEIARRMKLERPHRPRDRVCASTIYRWIDSHDDRAHWRGYLWRRGKALRKPRNSPSDAGKARIASRPEVIERRERLGDFEGDLVLGKQGTGGLATFVDRKSRYVVMTKVIRKDSRYVYRASRRRLLQLPSDRLHSMTLDNGGEFARFRSLEERLGMTVYWADPGRPYQRGTNENTNGLARHFFPKGTDFNTVTHWDVEQVEKLLNNRPRACLGYRTPNEVFHRIFTPLCCD
jgi:IS30 family transposase